MSGYAEPWVSMPACALPSVCRRDRQSSMPGMIWKDMGRGESVSYQCFYAWVQIEQSLCHLLDVAPKRWHFSGRIFWNSPSLPTEVFCGFRGLTVILVCYVGPWMGRIPFSSKTITHLQSVRCPEEGRDNWELHSVALMTRVVSHLCSLEGNNWNSKALICRMGPLWVLMRSWNCSKDQAKVSQWWELYSMHNEFYLSIWARCVGDSGLDPKCSVRGSRMILSSVPVWTI